MISLGIDIGGSGIKAAPVDTQTGRLIKERQRLKTPHPATPESIARAVEVMVRHFEWKGPVGAAFPARVKNGVALTASNIDKSFIGTDVAALFEKATGLPFRVINDADAAGVAEVRAGSGKDRDGVVMLVTIGTGIGSALFLDGRLVPNTELGWVRLGDGQFAEPYAADRVRKAEDLSWRKWAKRFQEYLERIEFLFAPDLIIVGGGVSKPERWAKFADALETTAELVPARFRNEAGIVGAALIAAEAAEPAAGASEISRTS